MLCSPIILYDHAQVAPESASAFFDALEVDELLSLRTMTLSEEEKREARGTDPRTAALLDEVDAMPARPVGPAARHGALRRRDDRAVRREPCRSRLRRRRRGGTRAPTPPSTRRPTRSRSAGSRSVAAAAWCCVPAKRRADAYDLFLAGREATVAAVLHDVDAGRHLAVTVDDDPGADLKAAHGRYLYFAPDEVEPLGRGRGRRPCHDARVLVACVGNIFLGDDGFGSRSARRLAGRRPAGGHEAGRLRDPQRAPGLRAARRVRRAGAGRHRRPSRTDRPARST